MFRKALITCGLCSIIVLATGAGGAAQYFRPKPGDTANDPLTGHLVKTGLYVFSGSTNSLLRLTGNGLIVVDGQPPANYDALTRHVNKISDQPIRLLITTDHHEERTGSNAKFVEDGTAILAQDNAAKNLARAYPNKSGIAPPTKTYDRELPIALGGIDLKVLHFGNAHTSGDSIVYFPNLKTVAVGDLYASTPDVDYAAGGSLAGWGPVLGEVLKLDFDTVVPGAGPSVTRADLEAFKAKIETLTSRASALVRKGVPKNQFNAELKTDDLGWHLNFSGTRLDRLYAEFSRAATH